MAYGTAFGSTLTDLGRNLVASETTRNQLQAALAAVAAQENIARTQAGSSRYSTDAQREANQLNQAFRAMENQRLRDATQTEAGLRDRDIISREAMNRFQFAPNTPAEREKERQKEIDVAKIIAEAQKVQSNRVDPRFAAAQLDIDFETAMIAQALPAAEAAANLESESLFKNRSRWLKFDAGEKSEYQKSALAIVNDPKYAAVGKYLVPAVQPDGRVLFKANFNLLPRRQAQPELNPPTPPPTPIPTPTIDPNRPVDAVHGNAPLSIGELSTILGGANVGVNAPPLRATGIPTSRASASAAALMDPILADAINQVTSRIQELTARGFSPAQAESKARAELPVVVRERLIELHRAMRQ